jgi:hypothetical protein
MALPIAYLVALTAAASFNGALAWACMRFKTVGLLLKNSLIDCACFCFDCSYGMRGLSYKLY